MTSFGPFFQALKGFAPVDLSGFILPIQDSDFALEPILCTDEALMRNDVVEMLTTARRQHSQSFLTYFEATEERTKKWLLNVVAPDESRVIFSVRSVQKRHLYGYLGVAFGDPAETYIEIDSVARHSASRVPGLMRKALLELVHWLKTGTPIKEVRVRVLGDVRAREFYTACGFVPTKEVPLYAVRDESGRLTELSESPHPFAAQSARTLLHMAWRGHALDDA